MTRSKLIVLMFAALLAQYISFYMMCDLPLIHVMFCVVQPHPHLDGVALPDEMEDVLHGGD